MKSLRFVIVLGSMILTGCGSDPAHPNLAAFNRQAETVEKTYAVPMSRLVACMIDDDQHPPHLQFNVALKNATFDLPGMMRMQLTARDGAEARAVVTGIPGDKEARGLKHYVGVLDRCADRR